MSRTTGMREHAGILRVGLIAVGAVSGVALALLALNLAGTPGSGQNRPLYVGGSLITSNRDRLAICVQPVDFDGTSAGSVGANAKSSIESALSELANTHPVWKKAGFSELPPAVVDIGCPSPPALFDEEAGPISPSEIPILGRFVREPSIYRTYVFVLPKADPLGTLRNEPVSQLRVTDEERIRYGDVSHPVTTGVYLTLAEVDDPRSVRELLDDAIGLESDW